MNILNNRLSILLACWLFALICLFYIIEQDKPTEQKFSFIKLFYSPDVKQFSPLIPELEHQTMKKIVEVVDDDDKGNPLLPNGYEAGSGIIGVPKIEYNDNGNFTIIIPYAGTLKNYIRSKFVKGNVRARILHFAGEWEVDFFQQILKTGYCARLVQMAKQKNELRVSISAANGILAVYEEVRYTDSEIIIYVRQDKGNSEAIPILYDDTNVQTQEGQKVKSINTQTQEKARTKNEKNSAPSSDILDVDGKWYNLFYTKPNLGN